METSGEGKKAKGLQKQMKRNHPEGLHRKYSPFMIEQSPYTP